MLLQDRRRLESIENNKPITALYCQYGFCGEANNSLYGRPTPTALTYAFEGRSRYKIMESVLKNDLVTAEGRPKLNSETEILWGMRLWQIIAMVAIGLITIGKYIHIG